MTRLTLSTSSANAANVSIFSSTDHGPARANRDVVIMGGRPNTLDLKRGEYVVRADWANGAVSTHYVSIGQDEVRLALDDESDVRRSPTSTAQTQGGYVANTANPTDFVLDIARASSRGYRGGDAFSSIDWSEKLQRTDLRNAGPAVPVDARSTTCDFRIYLWDKAKGDFRMVEQPEAPDLITPRSDHLTEDTFGFVIKPKARCLIEIKKAEAPARVVAFPGFSKDHSFYVSLRNSAGAPRMLPSISSRAEDPSLQGLLDILANPGASNSEGLLDAAQHDGRAQEYLYAKTQDPFAAAAGGYLLIRHRRLDMLHNWPRNLTEWFPDLPDAPIISGWQTLLMSSDDESESRRDAQAALRAFADAVARGLPIFDEGLSLLDTGLKFVTRLIGKDDQELCSNLRRTLRPLLENRAPFGPFLGFIGEAPDRPGASEQETAPPTFTVQLV